MSNLQSSLSSQAGLDVLKVPLAIGAPAAFNNDVKVKRSLRVKPVVQVKMRLAGTTLSFNTVRQVKPRRASRINRMWKRIKLL